jgi:hypothetical protein
MILPAALACGFISCGCQRRGINGWTAEPRAEYLALMNARRSATCGAGVIDRISRHQWRATFVLGRHV